MSFNIEVQFGICMELDVIIQEYVFNYIMLWVKDLKCLFDFYLWVFGMCLLCCLDFEEGCFFLYFFVMICGEEVFDVVDECQ